MNYLLVLGREPKISLAELEALFSSGKVKQIAPNLAIVTAHSLSLDRLGGSIKAGLILDYPTDTLSTTLDTLHRSNAWYILKELDVEEHVELVESHVRAQKVEHAREQAHARERAVAPLGLRHEAAERPLGACAHGIKRGTRGTGARGVRRRSCGEERGRKDGNGESKSFHGRE